MLNLDFCQSRWPRGLRRRTVEIVGSNPTGGWMFAVNVVFCQVEVSAMMLSLIQRSPTECGASLCVI